MDKVAEDGKRAFSSHQRVAPGVAEAQRPGPLTFSKISSHQVGARTAGPSAAAAAGTDSESEPARGEPAAWGEGHPHKAQSRAPGPSPRQACPAWRQPTSRTLPAPPTVPQTQLFHFRSTKHQNTAEVRSRKNHDLGILFFPRQQGTLSMLGLPSSLRIKTNKSLNEQITTIY